MKIVMAKAAADLLRGCAIADEASGMRAAREAVKVLAERGRGTGGLILLDREGGPAFAFNTPHMAYGYVAGDGTFVTGV